MKNPTPKKQPDKFVPFLYPIKLKNKQEQPGKGKHKDFLDVVMARRSVTDFSLLTQQEISELLYLSTKINSFQIDEMGFVLTKRTSPSGGARHPIDLLVSPATSMENRTLSYYNPVDHTLGELLISQKPLQTFFNEISQNIPIQNACIVWFAIQTAKTASKYENPESLYWKDTGALLYCIQLIATYLGFRSCPLGTLAYNSFHGLFNTTDIISGGGMLLGS